MSNASIPYWDLWERLALQCGVSPEVAKLGRTVMRDWQQYGRDDTTLGAEADGDFMIDLALNDPEEALRRFNEALGGESGAPPADE